MAALAVNPADVTKVFLTHLHSDHIISLPELYLFPWASQGRNKPLQVWGPDGTRSMMKHLQEAFAFDIHIRRDVDEKFSAEGIKVLATDIREGVVYEANGVKVTAFLVDHGPVKPAFGFRVDYHGHSVVVSGDTRPSNNLIKFSQGVDLLIHEVGSARKELMVNLFAQRIIAHHTTGEQAGQVFARVKPRLAVYSHAPATEALIAQTRKHYGGPLQGAEDLLNIEVGEQINLRRIVH